MSKSSLKKNPRWGLSMVNVHECAWMMNIRSDFLVFKGTEPNPTEISDAMLKNVRFSDEVQYYHPCPFWVEEDVVPEREVASPELPTEVKSLPEPELSSPEVPMVVKSVPEPELASPELPTDDDVCDQDDWIGLRLKSMPRKGRRVCVTGRAWLLRQLLETVS